MAVALSAASRERLGRGFCWRLGWFVLWAARWLTLIPAGGCNWESHLDASVLMRLLCSPDDGTMHAAAEMLGEMGPSVLGRVLVATRAPSPRLREGAALAMGWLGRLHGSCAEVVPSLVDLLADPCARVRAAAAAGLTLATAGDGVGSIDLMCLLSDPDPTVQIRAAGALAVVGGPAEVVALELCRMLDNPDSKVRAGGASALAEFLRKFCGPNATIQEKVVAALAVEGDPGIMRAEFDALTRLGPVAGVPISGALDVVVQDSADVALRVAAVRVLGLADADDEGALRCLLGVAIERDCWLREEAAKALGHIGQRSAKGAREARAALSRLLDDEDYFVRRAAAEALAATGGADPAMIEKLRELAYCDEYGEVRDAAMAAIQRLGEQSLR